MERIQKVIDSGGKPYAQPMIQLNALKKEPGPLRLDRAKAQAGAAMGKSTHLAEEHPFPNITLRSRQTVAVFHSLDKSRCDMNFDFEDTRRNLTTCRKTLGANTPAGHRCSNLIEQLENHRTATGEQKAHLWKNLSSCR